MYREDIKIPLERVAVLVGKKGSVKKKIEKDTKTRIKVDSKEGDIAITGDDSLNVYDSKQMVRAIARGFNPELAYELENENIILEVIDMQGYSGKSKAKLERLRGRCIGQDGKARRLIEELSDTSVSVYGKTVSIIGYTENVSLARRAFESILSGSKHGNVYKTLEKKRKNLRIRL